MAGLGGRARSVGQWAANRGQLGDAECAVKGANLAAEGEKLVSRAKLLGNLRVFDKVLGPVAAVVDTGFVVKDLVDLAGVPGQRPDEEPAGRCGIRLSEARTSMTWPNWSIARYT